MARVPVITSPCPLRWKGMPTAGMDFCGQCSRRVQNLDGMNDAERQAFFSACSGDVCVAYTVRRTGALAGVLSAGVAAAAALAGVSALAQDANVPTVVTGPTCDPNAKSDRFIDTIVVGGTIKAEAEWVDETDVTVPEPPQISEIGAAEWLPTPPQAQK